MIEQLLLLGQIVLAIILGGAIGYEREAADKPAGLRTHMLVAGSAAMLTGLAKVLVSEFDVNESLIQADPIRIIEAVITGISFLGAGTILRNRGENKVEGLTTAASLLMAAALGVGVAMNQFVLAVGTVMIVLLILHLVRIKLED
jgi:putative Mg2+ transporter-C (MgtC) family protein